MVYCVCEGGGGGGHLIEAFLVMMYRRPTFKYAVKRLCFRVFKEIANSIIAFWVRNTYFAFLIIAKRHMLVCHMQYHV